MGGRRDHRAQYSRSIMLGLSGLRDRATVRGCGPPACKRSASGLWLSWASRQPLPRPSPRQGSPGLESQQRHPCRAACANKWTIMALKRQNSRQYPSNPRHNFPRHNADRLLASTTAPAPAEEAAALHSRGIPPSAGRLPPCASSLDACPHPVPSRCPPSAHPSAHAAQPRPLQPQPICQRCPWRPSCGWDSLCTYSSTP